MNFVGSGRNAGRVWVEVPADNNGDAIVAALTEAGVEYLFFTSGSEISFFQEGIAKARAKGRKAPKLITVTHEHVSLNAALGYTAVSGRPAVTAAHVDCGTQHYGGAVHTAWHTPMVMAPREASRVAISIHQSILPGGASCGGLRRERN
jgi:acetolactate synthase-1/2/3 large subunit